ncbi:MAG: hypothetical protein IJ552_03990 [Prevotella sp.]|nr:hypothetical protein [Prevotella sp.]
MKKTYMTPDMEVVKINAQQQLLAGSVSENISDAVGMGSGEFGSHQLEELLDSDFSLY